MTRIALVDGCNFYIYREIGGKHKGLHVHISGPGWAASVSLDNPEDYEGNIPRNKRKAILAFISSRRALILAAIEDINNNRQPGWIE